MGITNSNLSKNDKNNIKYTSNSHRTILNKNNMNENTKKNNISVNLNNNYRFFSKNRFNHKGRTDKSHKQKQLYDPKSTPSNTDASHIKDKVQNDDKYEKVNKFISTFCWTMSSEFDQDLVSSSGRLEPIKSMSLENFAPRKLFSVEGINPLTRMGSNLITSIAKSLSLGTAECQGNERKFRNDRSNFVPQPSKDDKMNLDACSSRTSSTELSDTNVSVKRQSPDRQGKHDDATAYVSTTATTNGIEFLDESPEKRSNMANRNEHFVNEQGQKEENISKIPRVEFQYNQSQVSVKNNVQFMSINEHKMTCIPPCFRPNVKIDKQLSEKPSYNSLCTKCMHKDDKLPKGFKGMIIQLPSNATQNKPPERSPILNRSNIVVQTALVNGKSIEDVYEITHDKLGKGSYGNVWRGVHKESGAVRAIKMIRKANIENAMRMKREIQIMKTLDHPNIIKLFEVYEDAECLYLVMEVCSGGELFDRIVHNGSFSENYAAFIMRQVFSAIAYCHNKNVLHRDLKPENILYSNNSNASTVKIIDWGFATKCYRSHKFTSLVGTPYYVAPEVLLGNYDKACDIWSAGVILFILLVGYPPFHGSDNAEILKNVKRGSINFIPKHWSHVSKSAMDLITRCLSYIPKNRITAEEALNHEWILKCTTIPPTVAPHVSKSLARRFKNFLKYSKMKQMALTCIAYQLTEDEIAPLNSAFEALDRDGNGVLSLSEVADGLHTSKQTPSNIERIVRGLDTDNSGIIEYTEFIAASIDTRLYNQNDFCKRAFNIFDTDGDGRITRDDMIRVFTGDSTCGQVTLETVDEIINEVDADKDGNISYKEFYSMLYGWPEAK